MAFAGKRVRSCRIPGHARRGVPADFPQGDALTRAKYLTEAADCEACHTAEGGKPFAGGRPFDTDFGTIYSRQHHARSRDRHRRLDRCGLPEGRARGFQQGQGLALSGLSLRRLHLSDRRGRAGHQGVPVQPAAAEERAAAQHAALPVQPAPADGDLVEAVRRECAFPAGCERSAAWNRGAYLAEALGHCGDCHTPRTPLQSLDNRRKFSGGLSEGWRAYNLTSDADLRDRELEPR